MIFQHLFNWPLGNLSDPRDFEIQNTHSFHLDIEANVRIGIWHYIPSDLKYNFEKDSTNHIKDHFAAFLNKQDSRPIIIYAHGYDRNRAEFARRSLCGRLRDLGYHVFALDYRGYGDSIGTPTEKGVVNDLITLYNFIKSYKKDSKLFLWGHSLGTGIVSHAAKVLSKFKSQPNGVILEAPFLNISMAATDFIVAPFIYNNQWVISRGNQALKELEIKFNTDKNILLIKSKILILHAEDDFLIPHDRGAELYKIAIQKRPKNFPEVTFMSIAANYSAGHCNIYKHEEIYPVIKNFIGF